MQKLSDLTAGIAKFNYRQMTDYPARCCRGSTFHRLSDGIGTLWGLEDWNLLVFEP